MRLPESLQGLNFRKLKIFLALSVVFLAVLTALFLLFIRDETDLPLTEREKQAEKLLKPTSITAEGKTIQIAPKVEEITPEELNNWLLQKKSLKIVHVATAQEWQESHLKGSIFLTLESLSSPSVSLKQNENLVLISKDGVDSVLAADKLISNFAFNQAKVRSLKGGLDAWEKAGYEVEK